MRTWTTYERWANKQLGIDVDTYIPADETPSLAERASGGLPPVCSICGNNVGSVVCHCYDAAEIEVAIAS